MNTAGGRSQSDQYNEEIQLHTLEVAIAPALKPSLSDLPGAFAMLWELPRVGADMGEWGCAYMITRIHGGGGVV